MDIKINPQSPDGLNITIENIVVDTYEEALVIIQAIEKFNQKYRQNLRDKMHDMATSKVLDIEG